MNLSIAALVLLAALLHASWNALLKGGSDRLWSMTVMCAAIAILCAAALPFLPLPLRPSWPSIALSAALHIGYNLVLIRAYRSGEFGLTYPIARGSAPLLVTLGAALVAREVPGALGMAGIALVSAGILSLAFRERRLPDRGLFYAIATGVIIAAYSVTDGVGVRLSGNAAAYTMWMCLLWGVLMVPFYVALRGWRSLVRGARETGLAGCGGAVSLLAYGLVLFAMTRGPMGPVSALRETSVVFAAVLGRVFFHETLTARRLLSCCVVAAGALCLG